MRNFTNEEIKDLIINGFLMPAGEKYYIQYYPNKVSKLAPVGYPVLFDKKEFIKRNNTFPVTILKEYQLNFETPQRYFNDNYLVPNGIQEFADFNLDNIELVNKFQEWVALSEIFILEQTTGKKQEQIESDLLKLFRELYYLYLMDRKAIFSPIDNLFFDLFENGQHYRHLVKKKTPKDFDTFNNNPDIFSHIIDTTDDLVLFEKSAIANTNKHHHSYYCSIRNSSLNLWNYLLYRKSILGSYKVVSPFYEQFRKVLFNSNYNRLAIKDTTLLLEWLDRYDFSLLQDIYLELLKKSNKVALSNYVKEKLTIHNALPQVSKQLVIKKVSSFIYKDIFTFDFSLIKSFVNDHLYAGQCLVAIVEKSFRENELDCSKLGWNHFTKENIIVFFIETVQEDKIDMLSKKLVGYMNVVLSPEFLDDDMIKLLCKHASNAYSRKEYEKDKKVMAKYFTLKDKFLLKEKLEQKLVSKNTNEKIKKI